MSGEFESTPERRYVEPRARLAELDVDEVMPIGRWPKYGRVYCPRCGAPPGAWCTNVGSDGLRARAAGAHTTRMNYAKKVGVYR